MANIFTTCDLCAKEIHYGSAYVVIERNIEEAFHNVTSNKDETQIIDSEVLITLCGKCGNEFQYDVIAKIIQAVPANDYSIKKN
jgi:hypothetical protein